MNPSTALARKWRPRSFESLKGQEHVVKALTHALSTGRIHHAYLLTGTRGVGKTTIARILAKALNCETGLTATPCGQCQACTSIDSGHFPDYLEMDAASNRGVEEMAQVLDSAAYAPTSGRYKVFVIDEVHMLTNHAFNSMLKTLEEPPAHVVFILATTDPQKVPVTVLSRCLQFSLRNMPVSQIVEHLSAVLAAEAIEFEAAALPVLAKAARGSMRDALSLLDQAIAHGAGQVRAAEVQAMLGAVDGSEVIKLFELLAAGDGAGLLNQAPMLEAANLPLDKVLLEMAAIAHRLALVQLKASGDHDYSAEVMERLAGILSAEYLQIVYQVALHGARDIGLAPDELTGFTMTLVRMLAFLPQGQGASKVAPIAPVAPKVAALQAPVAKLTVPAMPVAPRASDSALAMAASAAALAPAAPVPAVSEVSNVPASVQAVSSDRLEFNGDWPGLTASIRCGGIVRQILLGSELVAHEGNSFKLRVQLKNWAEASSVAKVKEALSEHFGQTVSVSIVHGAVTGPTAESLANEDRAQRQAEAELSIQNDGTVQSFLQEFSGTIVPGSIKPASRSGIG